MARSRVVVVGAGFGGFYTLRGLERRLGADVDLLLVNPDDHHLYTPLLPQVAGGIMHPADIAVPLRGLKRTRLRLGRALAVDLTGRTLTVADPEGVQADLGYDRLVLAPGSVTRLFDLPGLREYAHGFKTIGEAVYLRERVLAQLEQAATTPDGPERASLTTFIVVGAGLAGTEYIAQMQTFVSHALSSYPALRAEQIRWILLDMADEVLPQLGAKLSEKALQVLRSRGVEVRLSMSVARLTADTATLSDGTQIPCRLLVWTGGVTAEPLIDRLGLPTEKGRLTVDEMLGVPGYPGVFALGDAAAVPDLARGGALCPQTAQHAMRQGTAAARNVAASLGRGSAAPYRHRDLGTVADLGGGQAVAAPIGLTLSGLLAKTVTNGYHLAALPSSGNRLRVAADWALNAITRRPTVSFGLIPDAGAGIVRAEQTSLPDAATAPRQKK